MLLSADRSQLLIVDIQERLRHAVAGVERVIAQARLLIESAKRLGVPILACEENPQGLGPTVPEIREALGNEVPILPKLDFSGARDEAILTALADGRRKGRPQVVVAGLESHVCVMQTVLELNDRGYDMFVVADAVASRAAESRELALQRMRSAGVTVVNTEMTLFEWLGTAASPQFKEVLALLK